jgi:hypothetical protein
VPGYGVVGPVVADEDQLVLGSELAVRGLVAERCGLHQVPAIRETAALRRHARIVPKLGHDDPADGVGGTGGFVSRDDQHHHDNQDCYDCEHPVVVAAGI